MLQDVATLLAANTYKKGAKQLLQLEKLIFVTCFLVENNAQVDNITNAFLEDANEQAENE